MKSLSCPKQIFTQVSQSAFDCVKQKAVSIGITLDRDQGQQSKNGVTVAWTFDPAAQTLELECLGKPFFVSCDAINGKIQEVVGSCMREL